MDLKSGLKKKQNDKVMSFSFTELLLLSITRFLNAKLCLCEKSQEIQLSYFFLKNANFIYLHHMTRTCLFSW